MVQSNRGGPPLEKLCEKHGARLGFRLRCEYVPGPPPFPDSAEEAEWLGRRETLVVTVLGVPSGGLIFTSWTKGGAERSGQAALTPEELRAWTQSFEASHGWDLPSFAVLHAGEASIDFEHEAYEYLDNDPDSLDLESWKPPRHWRIERGRNGAAEPQTRAVLRGYARFLPADLVGSSPLGAAFA